MLEVSQDLNKTSLYEYTTKSSDDPGRFSIKLKKTFATATSANTSANTTTTATIDASSEQSGLNIFLKDKSLYLRSGGSYSSDATMAIYSLNGSEASPVENISLNSGEYVYDMSRYQPGMYIVKVLVNKTAFTRKIHLQ